MFDWTAPFTSTETRSVLHLSSAEYDRALRNGYLQASASIRTDPPCAQPFHSYWDMLRFAILKADFSGLMVDKEWQAQLDTVLDDISTLLEEQTPETIIPLVLDDLISIVVGVSQAARYRGSITVIDRVVSMLDRIFWGIESGSFQLLTPFVSRHGMTTRSSQLVAR